MKIDDIMDKIFKTAGKISTVHMEKINLDEPFIDLAYRFSGMPGTVCLMSGGDLDCARYHILAAKPWLTFTGRKQKMRIQTDSHDRCFYADPFDTLRRIRDTFNFDNPNMSGDPALPVKAGLFGYLSYDLKDRLEKLPHTSIDDLNLPDICFFAPSLILVHDKQKEHTWLCIPEREGTGEKSIEDDRNFFCETIRSTPPEQERFSGNKNNLKSGFTKNHYMDTVDRIIEYIASGHVYQVNMSQRFETVFEGDAFSLFKTLYNKNPAPFFAYINAGDHQIISTSPERFLKQDGRYVETRPIKGTRPRGKTEADDQRLRRELQESKKDDAELSMIVDLLRNDLGKVCESGTVRVAEHKRLEAYENVYHLVSTVEGTLARNRDSVDLLAATFPGGSITGCPKIRAMEIIDELEPVRRHIYTGSIGCISFHDTMNLSIAIRTATVYNEKIFFSVGGGIVYDSDPADEFQETLHKGRTLMDIFKDGEKSGENKNMVWMNGSILPIEDASVPVSDPGFQYGYGFFETIRVEKGRPKYFTEHMARFNTTWEKLFYHEPPDLTWDDIISQVIFENRLQDKTAAVKILAAKGERDVPPYNNTLLVTARPYTHRLAEKKKPDNNGLNLAIYPEPRQTPLADHKTLNYLYYLLAGKWAKSNSADEAVILNPDGTVSETNTANILLMKGKTVILPDSLSVLPGIMERQVCKILENREFGMEKKKVQPDDLFSADQVVITNSLIGVVPVLSIDGREMPEPFDIWDEINREVLL